MTAYIVQAAHWEDDEILGVYASEVAAMAAHPAPAGHAWKKNTEPGHWYVDGLSYGYSMTIAAHVVKGAE